MLSPRFYQSKEWKALRLQALRRDGYRCVMCGEDINGKGLSRVDHIKPVRDYPSLALSLGNLRCLCAPCDNRRHAEKGGGPAALSGCDIEGSPINPSHPWAANNMQGRKAGRQPAPAPAYRRGSA